MSQCTRPGASSDAAFVLKQFLRISSKKYTNENRRLDVVFGYFSFLGLFLYVRKCVIPDHRQHQEPKVIQTLVLQVSLQSSSCFPELTAVLAFLRHVEVRVNGLLQSFAHQRLLCTLFTLPEDHGAVKRVSLETALLGFEGSLFR